jgi:magnesium transporter
MIVELLESVLPKRRPTEGAHPGALAFPEIPAPVAVTAIRYSKDRIQENDQVDIDALRPELADDEVLWLDIQGLSDRDLFERLAADYGIHPLAMSDILHTPQAPGMESYAKGHHVIARMMRVVDGEPHAEQVSLWVSGNYVLTIQEHRGDVLDPVRRRIREQIGYIRKRGADYLVYAIIDALVDGYYPVADVLSEELTALERSVIEGETGRDELMRIYELESELQGMTRPMRQQRDLIRTLLREDSLFSKGVRPFVKDVHDHAAQVLDVVDTYREMAGRLMDLHLSMSNNRVNEVMKVLSIIASIFVPATFVAAVYGMNFDYMPETQWVWGYPAALMLMAALATAMLLYFRLTGMLR